MPNVLWDDTASTVIQPGQSLHFDRAHPHGRLPSQRANVGGQKACTDGNSIHLIGKGSERQVWVVLVACCWCQPPVTNK